MNSTAIISDTFRGLGKETIYSFFTLTQDDGFSYIYDEVAKEVEFSFQIKISSDTSSSDGNAQVVIVRFNTVSGKSGEAYTIYIDSDDREPTILDHTVIIRVSVPEHLRILGAEDLVPPEKTVVDFGTSIWKNNGGNKYITADSYYNYIRTTSIDTDEDPLDEFGRISEKSRKLGLNKIYKSLKIAEKTTNSNLRQVGENFVYTLNTEVDPNLEYLLFSGICMYDTYNDSGELVEENRTENNPYIVFDSNPETPGKVRIERKSGEDGFVRRYRAKIYYLDIDNSIRSIESDNYVDIEQYAPIKTRAVGGTVEYKENGYPLYILDAKEESKVSFLLDVGDVSLDNLSSDEYSDEITLCKEYQKYFSASFKKYSDNYIVITIKALNDNTDTDNLWRPCLYRMFPYLNESTITIGSSKIKIAFYVVQGSINVGVIPYLVKNGNGTVKVPLRTDVSNPDKYYLDISSDSIGIVTKKIIFGTAAGNDPSDWAWSVRLRRDPTAENYYFLDKSSGNFSEMLGITAQLATMKETELDPIKISATLKNESGSNWKSHLFESNITIVPIYEVSPISTSCGTWIIDNPDQYLYENDYLLVLMKPTSVESDGEGKKITIMQATLDVKLIKSAGISQITGLKINDNLIDQKGTNISLGGYTVTISCKEDNPTYKISFTHRSDSENKKGLQLIPNSQEVLKLSASYSIDQETNGVANIIYIRLGAVFSDVNLRLLTPENETTINFDANSTTAYYNCGAANEDTTYSDWTYNTTSDGVSRAFGISTTNDDSDTKILIDTEEFNENAKCLVVSPQDFSGQSRVQLFRVNKDSPETIDWKYFLYNRSTPNYIFNRSFNCPEIQIYSTETATEELYGLEFSKIGCYGIYVSLPNEAVNKDITLQLWGDDTSKVNRLSQCLKYIDANGNESDLNGKIISAANTRSIIYFAYHGSREDISGCKLVFTLDGKSREINLSTKSPTGISWESLKNSNSTEIKYYYKDDNDQYQEITTSTEIKYYYKDVNDQGQEITQEITQEIAEVPGVPNSPKLIIPTLNRKYGKLEITINNFPYRVDSAITYPGEFNVELDEGSVEPDLPEEPVDRNLVEDQYIASSCTGSHVFTVSAEESEEFAPKETEIGTIRLRLWYSQNSFVMIQVYIVPIVCENSFHLRGEHEISENDVKDIIGYEEGSNTPIPTYYKLGEDKIMSENRFDDDKTFRRVYVTKPSHLRVFTSYIFSKIFNPEGKDLESYRDDDPYTLYEYTATKIASYGIIDGNDINYRNYFCLRAKFDNLAAYLAKSDGATWAYVERMQFPLVISKNKVLEITSLNETFLNLLSDVVPDGYLDWRVIKDDDNNDIETKPIAKAAPQSNEYLIQQRCKNSIVFPSGNPETIKAEQSARVGGRQTFAFEIPQRFFNDRNTSETAHKIEIFDELGKNFINSVSGVGKYVDDREETISLNFSKSSGSRNVWTANSSNNSLGNVTLTLKFNNLDISLRLAQQNQNYMDISGRASTDGNYFGLESSDLAAKLFSGYTYRLSVKIDDFDPIPIQITQDPYDKVFLLVLPVEIKSTGNSYTHYYYSDNYGGSNMNIFYADGNKLAEIYSQDSQVIKLGSDVVRNDEGSGTGKYCWGRIYSKYSKSGGYKLPYTSPNGGSEVTYNVEVAGQNGEISLPKRVSLAKDGDSAGDLGGFKIDCSTSVAGSTQEYTVIEGDSSTSTNNVLTFGIGIY